MNKNKKMEIIYVKPFEGESTSRPGGSWYKTIDGFPVWYVKIIGQNLDGPSFVELVNHFKGVFDKCEYALYASSNNFNQDLIFPGFYGGSDHEGNPYWMLEEPDVRLKWVNPALLVDPNKRTLTYEGITRIHAKLKGSLPEQGRYGIGHDDCIDLQFILEKEVLTSVDHFKEWWRDIIDRVIDQLNKPYFISAKSNTPVSSLKLLNILHEHYGIKPEVIDDSNEQIRSIVINKLSSVTPKSNVASKTTNKQSLDYQV